MKNKDEYGYTVNINTNCDHHERSPEEYGSWSSSYSNNFESITKIDINDKCPDVTSIHDFQVGDVAYLVWAEWSSGDSFGNANCSDTEAFGLLKEASDAFALATALREAKENTNAKNWDDHYKFEWKSSDGQKVVYGFLPWLGYFECLDNIYVETVQIGHFTKMRF